MRTARHSTVPPDATRNAAEVVDAALIAFAAQSPAGAGAPVAIIVPAFNEAETVAAVIEDVPQSVCGLVTEVLVIDDGSTDGTAEQALSAGALVCRLLINLGQGEALKVGYRLAAERGATIIVTADADGQFDLTELPALVEPLVSGDADFVNGSRRLGRSETSDLVRRFGLLAFGAIVSVLARQRITDPANGLRAFRVEVITSVPLLQSQYQTSELLIRALARGFRVREVAVTVRERSAGHSKKGGNLTYGFGFARAVITTWWAERGRARR